MPNNGRRAAACEENLPLEMPAGVEDEIVSDFAYAEMR
jgi:hypothetical protein